MKYLSNGEITGFMKHIVKYNVMQLKVPKGDTFVSDILTQYGTKFKKSVVGEESIKIRKNGKLVTKNLDHG
jgi:uncharacterized protein with HEPN domain